MARNTRDCNFVSTDKPMLGVTIINLDSLLNERRRKWQRSELNG